MVEKLDEDEVQLLGLALVCAQRVEFALYGIASHTRPDAAPRRKDRRFKNLTPESFLRGDVDDLKATLGQLVETFGDSFHIRTEDLVEFYKDRNFIAHDYVRTFHMNVKGRSPAPHSDRKRFLLNFIDRAQSWENILRGLISVWTSVLAIRHNRTSEFTPTIADLRNAELYREHVARYLASRKNQTHS